MSKYTTEIRYICEHLCGLDESKGYNDVDTIIAQSRTKVFNFPYPIFDENYRSVLETKILKHFYTREIGEETVGLWKLRLNRKLNEIMPYYNKLYEMGIEDLNPFLSTDMKTERSTVGGTNRNIDEGIKGDSARTNISANSGDSTGKNKVNSRGLADNGTVDNAKHTDLYSDTPQGQLTGVDEETYLTNARKVEDKSLGNHHTYTLDIGDSTTENKTHDFLTQRSLDNSNSSRSTTEDVNSTERYIEHTYGYSGVLPVDVLKKYREVIWNIDLMIIDDLEPLFMQLW